MGTEVVIQRLVRSPLARASEGAERSEATEPKASGTESKASGTESKASEG